jgi:hypothetical protein
MSLGQMQHETMLEDGSVLVRGMGGLPDLFRRAPGRRRLCREQKNERASKAYQATGEEEAGTCMQVEMSMQPAKSKGMGNEDERWNRKKHDHIEWNAAAQRRREVRLLLLQTLGSREERRMLSKRGARILKKLRAKGPRTGALQVISAETHTPGSVHSNTRTKRKSCSSVATSTPASNSDAINIEISDDIARAAAPASNGAAAAAGRKGESQGNEDFSKDKEACQDLAVEEEQEEEPGLVLITAEHLAERRMVDLIYSDLLHHYYATKDWRPEFYCTLARAGFISVAEEQQGLLVPEMQRSYCLIELRRSACTLHAGKRVTKRSARYIISVDSRLDEVLEAIAGGD